MKRLEFPLGAPCWLDLQTSDTGRARSFYSDLFGWTALEESADFSGYWMWTKDGVPVAGGMKADDQAPVSDVWSVYLKVEDEDAALGRVTARGGQVIVPTMPVADLGAMAFVIDSTGAGIGMWQPDTFPGFGLWDEPGTPCWFELHTRDYAGALDFYRDVYGWQPQTTSDTDDFRYSVLPNPDGGTGGLAGVFDATTAMSAEMPPHWEIYFRVADAAAAVDRVTQLGGTVLRAPEDTPFGTMAVVTDATGGAFKLLAGGPQAG